MKRLLVSVICAVFAAGAFAQNPTRIRANVVAFDGKVLTVKTALGKEIRLSLSDRTAVAYPKALKLSDIKPGAYVGSAAMPGPDGKLVAREVHVFPEAQRGTGDGHRPWDEPGSTMTNGGVSKTVKVTNGQELVVQYKGGEKTILVPDGTPVVTFQPGDRSLLVPGAYVVITAQAAADGTLTAQRIQATGREGVKPPI
jgi:hypothetical protein